MEITGDLGAVVPHGRFKLLTIQRAALRGGQHAWKAKFYFVTPAHENVTPPRRLTRLRSSACTSGGLDQRCELTVREDSSGVDQVSTGCDFIGWGDCRCLAEARQSCPRRITSQRFAANGVEPDLVGVAFLNNSRHGAKAASAKARSGVVRNGQQGRALWRGVAANRLRNLEPLILAVIGARPSATWAAFVEIDRPRGARGKSRMSYVDD